MRGKSCREKLPARAVASAEFTYAAVGGRGAVQGVLCSGEKDAVAEGRVGLSLD